MQDFAGEFHVEKGRKRMLNWHRQSPEHVSTWCVQLGRKETKLSARVREVR